MDSPHDVHDPRLPRDLPDRDALVTGDAVVPESSFDFLLDHARYEHDPFCTPSLPIATVDYCIGLNASSLVRDGGTLQLGIGELADWGRAAVAGQARRGVSRAAAAD